MSGEHHGIDLLPVITLLCVAVIAAPLFKRLGLGSVLGYLAGGLLIGPFGIGVFTQPEFMLKIAELGVVMFLFIIGLEIRPSRLWGLRRQIFGVGLLQVVACALLLTGVGVANGVSFAPSFVAGAGFVLTSTATVMQLLDDRRELASPAGQRIMSILLLEDLMIVPLLAMVSFLAPPEPGSSPGNPSINWTDVGIGVGSIIALLLAGRFLLNPLFGVLAAARSREVMTAAALLVVLGSASAMQSGGLSMAMGAFLAGVLLSESSYRHQLEVDVEPFRGILLGLFFTAVGMSLDLEVVAGAWCTILLYVLIYMLIKGVAVYGIARLFRSCHRDAVDRAVVMAQGGEFAFVLYAAAANARIFDAHQNAVLTAIVILSMVLTPLAIAGLGFLRRHASRSAESRDRPEGLTGSGLVIGFGRVGQIASQFLWARNYDVSIIDTDVEMIDQARKFDFDVYYGDGTRLDILRAAGVAEARVVLVCVEKAEDATRIVQLLKIEHPRLPVIARATDRRHSIALMKAGADLQVRETFESALVLGAAALEKLGESEAQIAETCAFIRDRDQRRFQLELAGGVDAGRALFHGDRSSDADSRA
ncbi:MAG: monovalent cation:proton antiporter-2 (CPA2) family protein [Pseudomonadota bacterium]